MMNSMSHAICKHEIEKYLYVCFLISIWQHFNCRWSVLASFICMLFWWSRALLFSSNSSYFQCLYTQLIFWFHLFINVSMLYSVCSHYLLNFSSIIWNSNTIVFLISLILLIIHYCDPFIDIDSFYIFFNFSFVG